MAQQSETAAIEPKVAAYLCAGCGLGERLDLERLAKVAAESGANSVERHDMLCGESGVARIRSGIKDGATHLVLGACSRRAKTEAFDFADDGAAVARVNLREGVIWTQPDAESADDAEDARAKTQEMADDYVRMGCAEAKFMRAPQAVAASERGGNKRILVVGGGISGMTAAIEAARAGYAVLLVEKSGALGGWAKTLHRRLPRRAPFTAPADNDIGALSDALEREENVRVFLNAHITRTSGAPGRFSVDIEQDGAAARTENVGAIVQASGFRRYDAALLPEFAYGSSPDVVDQIELESLAAAAAKDDRPIARPSDGKAVQSVVFVQCAGQRSEQPGHLPYCSGCCCNISIKQAMYFKMRDAGIDANVIYTDLRAPGNGEDFYRAAQQMGVVFTNGAVARVETGGAQLAVHFRDHVLDEDAVAR
ncbi:MAG: FAD-dependent oxidoreductase, partial [Gammaproteobacteria bacterium]